MLRKVGNAVLERLPLSHKIKPTAEMKFCWRIIDCIISFCCQLNDNAICLLLSIVAMLFPLDQSF